MWQLRQVEYANCRWSRTWGVELFCAHYPCMALWWIPCNIFTTSSKVEIFTTSPNMKFCIFDTLNQIRKKCPWGSLEISSSLMYCDLKTMGLQAFFDQHGCLLYSIFNLFISYIDHVNFEDWCSFQPMVWGQFELRKKACQLQVSSSLIARISNPIPQYKLHCEGSLRNGFYVLTSFMVDTYIWVPGICKLWLVISEGGTLERYVMLWDSRWQTRHYCILIVWMST